MTSTHNLCECERERVLCASRSMRLPFAKCSLFTGVCARELDDFAFVIISVFANSFNFLYWPILLLLSQTAFILVDNEAKRRQMASLMRAPSEQHDQTSESKKANRWDVQLFYIRRGSASSRCNFVLNSAVSNFIVAKPTENINGIPFAEHKEIATMAFGLLLCHLVSANSPRAFTQRSHSMRNQRYNLKRFIFSLGIDRAAKKVQNTKTSTRDVPLKTFHFLLASHKWLRFGWLLSLIP